MISFNFWLEFVTFLRATPALSVQFQKGWNLSYGTQLVEINAQITSTATLGEPKRGSARKYIFVTDVGYEIDLRRIEERIF